MANLSGLTQLIDQRSGVLLLCPDALVGRLPADGIVELSVPAPKATRLSHSEREEKRTEFLTILRRHPSLADDLQAAARLAGITYKTAWNWLRDEERKFQQSLSVAETGS